MSSFHERQKNLFNHLIDAEKQCNFSNTSKDKDSQSPGYGEIDRRTYKKLKYEMKQFRGRESIFKRPEANLRECLRAKRIPDYMKNPQKWMYYSLSDVTPEQMSESTNTATALAFIREMEEKELAKLKSVDNSDDSIFKKPIFKISSTIKKENQETSKSSFESNKVIMPEYVVGMSKKKEKKQKVSITQASDENSAKTKRTELKLNHLYEEEDDE